MRRAARATQAGECGPLSPSSPLSFEEAAETLLRGTVTANTLRAAARRGELGCEKLGKFTVTTPADIEEWRALCRPKKQQGSTCAQQGVTLQEKSLRPPDTSFATADENLPLAAALAKAKLLKERSPPTSPRNMRPSAKNVISLKSGSPK